MLGLADYFSGNYQRALLSWKSLLVLSQQTNVPQEKIALLEKSIFAVQKRLASEPERVEVMAVSGANKDNAAGERENNEAVPRRLNVTVNLSASLQARLNVKDTLFIYAQKAGGPKMPLAVVKQQVGDFPLTVSLSDAQAMTPMFRLSKVDSVIVTARISATHNAIPAPGDFIGQSDVIDFSSSKEQVISLTVTIDSLVP